MVAWSEEFDTAYPSDWGPDWTEGANDASDAYSVAAGVASFALADGTGFIELHKDAIDVLDSSHWRMTARFRISTIPAGEYVELDFLPGSDNGPLGWIEADRNPSGPSYFGAFYFVSQSVAISTWQRNVWHFLEIDFKPERSVEYRLWASGETRPASPTLQEALGPFAPFTDTFTRTVDPGWGDPSPANELVAGYSFGASADAKVESGYAKLEFPSGGVRPQAFPTTAATAYPLPYTVTFLGKFSASLAAEATLFDVRGRAVSWYPNGTLRVSTGSLTGPTFGSPTDYATGLDLEQDTYVKVEVASATLKIKAWQAPDPEPAYQLTLISSATGSDSVFVLSLGPRGHPTYPLTGGWWTSEFTIDAPTYRVAGTPDPVVQVETFSSAGGGSEIDWIRIATRPAFDIGGGSCDSPMRFDVYDIGTATFPEITYLGTLCSAFDKVIRREVDGLGSGSFRINRYQADGSPNPEVSVDLLGAGIAGTPRLVIARIPEAAADEGVFGFFLTSGNFNLIDPGEKGGEVLEFGGPGWLSYLGWGVMDSASYITEPFVGEQPYNRTWHLYADSSITTVLLAYAANGTDDVVSSWQLPSINPPGDDLELVTFYQVRPIVTVTSSGWSSAVYEDTSGMDMGTGAGDFRYGILDREVDTGSPPYADTLSGSGATRWSAAQVGLRRVASSTPVQSAGDWTTTGSTKTATFGSGVTAGNALIAYATFTSGGSGTPVFDWPDGWTEIISVPSQNDHIGVASVAYKEADGSETGVSVTMTIDPSSVTSGVVLVREYELVPIILQPAGAILWRIVRELQEDARPQHPIPLLTMDFDYSVDSNGTPWQPTPSTAQFQAQVGEPVDAVAGRLLGTGSIGIRMTVDSTGFRLSAYNRDGFGMDRTGTDFAEGVVRFERAVNIGSASRKIVTGQLFTHELVQGDGDIYGRAEITDAADKPTREGFMAAGSQTDTAALNDMGAADLEQRRRNIESLPMPVLVGDDPTNGRYLPFKHYVDGDRVTAKTGSGPQDYDDATFSIAALTVTEPKGAKTASDLRVILELGSTIQVGTGSGSTGGSYGGGGITSSPGGGSTSTHSPVTLASDANAILGLAGQEIGLDPQAANTVFAGPATGANADPTMRALVDADIPSGIARDADVAALQTGTLNVLMDGGGAPISTGVKGDLVFDFAGTITQATVLGDQTGSIEIDIWKRAYASYPPTVTQSIVASAPPTISSGIKSQDSTLPGWTTSFSAGDVFRFNVNSVTAITRATLSLRFTRQ